MRLNWADPAYLFAQKRIMWQMPLGFHSQQPAVSLRGDALEKLLLGRLLAARMLKRRFIRRKVVDTKNDSGNNSPSFASEHCSSKPPKPLKRKSKRVGAHREPGMLESGSKCRSPSGPLRVHANAQQVACNVRHTLVVGSMKVLRKGHDSFRETRWHREF